MHPWVETILVIALSCAVFAAAYRMERGRWFFMAAGILAIAAALLSSGAFRGREYALLMCVAPPMVTAPLFRFPLSKVLRTGLLAITALSTAFTGWYEFLAAALSRRELAGLVTSYHNGICHQTTGYTCGPAAAVTLLRRMGLPAEEGELGLLSKCSNHTGTDGPLLADAINERYAADRLRATSQRIETVDALATAIPVLTVVNLDMWTDHWVMVMKVTETTVESADPICGHHIEPRTDFERRWRNESITVTRQ
jgi:hypothetical protein